MRPIRRSCLARYVRGNRLELPERSRRRPGSEAETRLRSQRAGGRSRRQGRLRHPLGARRTGGCQPFAVWAERSGISSENGLDWCRTDTVYEDEPREDRSDEEPARFRLLTRHQQCVVDHCPFHGISLMDGQFDRCRGPSEGPRQVGKRPPRVCAISRRSSGKHARRVPLSWPALATRYGRGRTAGGLASCAESWPRTWS
jgi:hypothetical protein